MARMYCMQDGKRFDKNHPLWPTKSDGNKYKILPKAVVEKLGLELVPSVTTVLRHSKGDGLLYWAYSSAIEACVDFITDKAETLAHPEIESGALFSDKQELYKELKSFVELQRNEAADAGSLIHEAFDWWNKGEDIEDDYYEMCELTRRTVIDETGLDIKKMASEFQFACSVDGLKYGGTIDLTDSKNVIDIKSTKGKRIPYINECSQLVAYNKGVVDSGALVNVYIDQTTLKPYSVKVWSKTEKEKAWTLFRLCYKMDEIL